MKLTILASIAYVILTLTVIGMVLNLIPSTLPVFATVCAAKVACFIFALTRILRPIRS